MEHEFKPFDKVLVRDGFDKEWKCNFFSHKSGNKFVCGGFTWTQCVSFEGNEHFVGKKGSPEVKQEYQWGDKVLVYMGGGHWEKALYSRKVDGGHRVYLGKSETGFTEDCVRPLEGEPQEY